MFIETIILLLKAKIKIWKNFYWDTKNGKVNID